jgi:ankyrin repeat protein
MKKKLMLLICGLTISYLAHAGEDPEFAEFVFVSNDFEAERSMTASASDGKETTNNGSSIIYYNSDRKMINDVIVYDDYLNCPEMIQPQNINEKDSFGDTRLHRAIEGDKVDEIRRLLRNGARHDIPNDLSGKTALALMMDNSSEQARQCFAEHGIIFISHTDLCDNSFFLLLENGGEKFNRLLLEFIGSDKVKKMVDILRFVFKKAWKRESSSEQGTIMTHQDSTCLVKVKISELHQWFGEPIISYTERVIAAYPRADSFIEQCNKKNYTGATLLLSQYPQLSKAICFNKYIMTKLLILKEDECWEFLLKDSKFGPNIATTLSGTILHGAAQALNPAALYYLVFFGADYNATNKNGKNPVDILVDGAKNKQFKESAEKCLCIVEKALKERMNFVKESAEYTESDKELLFASLIKMENFIRSVIPSNSKNITQLY